MLDQRGWKRLEWEMITERKLTWFEFEDGFCGAVEMLKVSEPFKVGKKQLVICDEGITWMQCGWYDKKVWATAMFDASGQMFQVYFDIADVFVDGEKTSFKDLIVDVVYDPEGTAVVLDCDELEEAYHKNLISCTEKQMIIDTAERLKNVLETCCDEVNLWFDMLFRKYLTLKSEGRLEL